MTNANVDIKITSRKLNLKKPMETFTLPIHLRLRLAASATTKSNAYILTLFKIIYGRLGFRIHLICRMNNLRFTKSTTNASALESIDRLCGCVSDAHTNRVHVHARFTHSDARNIC